MNFRAQPGLNWLSNPMLRAATLLCVACCSTAWGFDMDLDDSFSAGRHHQGAQIAEWLSNADLVSSGVLPLHCRACPENTS